jgi:hypothetical protein
VRVVYLDDEPNGLAALLGGLIEANVARHPERLELLKPAVIDLSACDADVSVTVHLSPGEVAVGNGVSSGTSHLHVRADSHALLLLASVPLRIGLPDPLSKPGRQVLGKLLRREIRVDRLFLHPGKLARFSKLLSVVD